MALIFGTGEISSPGATGVQAYTPNGGFSAGEPLKAIILTCTAQTADGTVNANQSFCLGLGTDRGGTPQQYYNTLFSLDAAAAADVAGGHNSTDILKLFSASAPTVDVEIALDSFSDTQFSLNWQNIHASTILVRYIAIGGSGVTDAVVGTFTLATSSPQNIALPAGFGVPDLMMFSSRVKTALLDSATDPGLSLGIDNGTQRAAHAYSIDDGTTTMVMRDAQKAKGFIAILEGAIDSEHDFDKAGSTGDNARITITDLPAAATTVIGYLALKGDFTSTIGRANAPTAAPTQVTNLTHSQAPKGAILWGRTIPAGAAIDTGHADLGAFRIFATDGTNEGGSLTCEDDAAVDARGGNVHRNTKALAKYRADAAAGGAPILASEADGSISGNNVVLTWNDTDATADEFCYCLFGDAAASGQTVAINRVTETGTAQAMVENKARTVNRITETGTAQAMARQKTLLTARVTETGTAQAIVENKARTLIRVIETGVVQAVQIRPFKIAVNKVTETGIAQTMARAKTKVVNRITETSVVQSITEVKSRALVRVTETGTAQAISRAKSRLVNRITETGTVQAMTRRKLVVINRVIETGIVQAISVLGKLNRVLETGIARPMAVHQGQAIVQVTETGIVRVMSRTKNKGVARITELGTVTPITSAKRAPVARVVETGVVRAMFRTKSRTLIRVNETGVVRPMTFTKVKGINRIIEVGIVRSMLTGQQVEISRVLETGLARPINANVLKIMPPFPTGRIVQRGTGGIVGTGPGRILSGGSGGVR